ncbi:MAG: hypothetical protein LBS96_06340 [Oscillospiraceae bacterium]|jgi:hypothetical protein|nr:hypothetical protein [Oscillospiraceae bacterium]
MVLVLPRLIVGALGLVLAILTLVLKNRKGIAARIFAALGGIGAVALLVNAVNQFADASDAVRALSLVPWLALGVVLLVQFVLLVFGKSAKLHWPLAGVALVQLGFAVYTLLTRWGNLRIGEPLWLQLQLALAALLLVDFVLFLFAALKKQAVLPSGLGQSDAHYARLGLQKGKVEPWEDGARTDGGPGSYEWWYFDAHLDDGTSLVLVYYTKRMMLPGKPLRPYATIDLDTPDGRHFEERLEVEGIPFSAAKDRCEVQIGPCYIKGDLDTYEIYFKNDVCEAKATLKSNVPPWRPATGHIFFGEKDENYFAWLPAVPEGSVTAEITVDGVTTQHTGTGYHDHNWGDANMMQLMHHWYWGRARVGEYRIISSYIYGEKKYGYKEYPIFLVAQPGRHIADNGSYLQFKPTGAFINAETGKPVHGTLTYEYHENDTHLRVIYTRESSIINFKMIEQLKGVQRFGAKLIGFDGAYHRFAGTVTVERLEDGAVVEHTEAPALWELMYFGKAVQ